MFSRACDLDRRCRSSSLLRDRNRFATAQIIRGQRFVPKQKLIERAVENQFTAALAATRTDVDQVVGRANDLLFVLDHEERVAAVAQIVHHPDEPADIARMQTDARLVQDKERIDERSAETGGEIDALHFATAQSARGTIEREIADADFVQIVQARANLVTQHLLG